MSPINLKSKGLKDLKKNKFCSLLETNSYYLSCPEADEMNDSDGSTELTNTNKLSIDNYGLNLSNNLSSKLILLNKNSFSEKKFSKKISFKLISNQEFGNEGLFKDDYFDNVPKFSYDCSALLTNSKRSFDMQLDQSHGIRSSLKGKKESKTTKLCFKKQMKFDEDNFILEENSDEEYNDLAPVKNNIKSSKFDCEIKVRSFSSIISKLEFMRNERITEEESD